MSPHEVVIARYGTRQGARSEVFLNYGIYGEPDAPIGMDYYVWVVRDAEHVIVVDTGFSAEGGRSRRRTTLHPPSEIWAALGIRSEDRPTVVVTHAHYDHIGNLDHFADSPVVIARREAEFWLGPLAGRAQFRHSVETAELDSLRAVRDAGRLVEFEGEHELAPGVRVIEVGGHTPGQSMVLVDTTDGPVLLTSDAVHYLEEYERDLPFAFVADLPAMYRGFDTIRAMLDQHRIAHLVPGHDPDTIARYPALTLGPQLEGDVAVIGALAGTEVTP